jgi:hypothetical protein
MSTDYQFVQFGSILFQPRMRRFNEYILNGWQPELVDEYRRDYA